MDSPNRLFTVPMRKFEYLKNTSMDRLPTMDATSSTRPVSYTHLQQKQHDADVAKAQKLEDYIARNLVRASTTKMAQSRRKQLEKLEITEKPSSGPQQLKFRFEFDVTPYNLSLIHISC